VAVFTAASAACGLANTQGLLVAGRFIQGLGGAAATSAIVAIIATEFQAPRERAKAMSVYTFVISGGASLGLITGGVITQAIDWHWIFFINVPIGAVTFLLGRTRIVENPGLGIGRGVDILGSVLITAALMLGAYSIVTSSSYGWTSAHTFLFGAAAVALIAAFIATEARLPNPIMPLRTFAIRGLAASSVVRGLLITGMYATFFLGVLYLERVRGFGVLQTSLAFLPQIFVLAVLSLGPTAWLVGRFGARVPLLIGLVAAGAGLLLLRDTGVHTHYFPGVLVAFVLMGIGAGFAFMPLLTIAMARVPSRDAGLASGIVNASLQMSAALGVAVLGTIATDHTRTLADQGQNHSVALLGGYHLSFLIATICVGAAVVASLVWLRKPTPRATVPVTDGRDQPTEGFARAEAPSEVRPLRPPSPAAS